MRMSSFHVRWALIASTAILLAACAGGSSGPTTAAPSASTAPPPSASSTAASPAVVFDGDIAVSDARTVRVHCVGHGAPTILLEAGGTGSNLGDWTPAFVDTLGAQTTTCAYSRAGGYGSPPMPDPWTMDKVVADADAMLAALDKQAGVKGPYVLVGWSFGGAVALAEALAHPDTTAGLVILDTDIPKDFLAVCPTSGRSKAECQAVYDEDRDAKVMGAELNHKIRPLPGIPIALVSAMQPDPACAPEPGASVVTYDLDGDLVSAPDCRSLMTAIADEGLTNWRQLGDQVVQTRLDASHDGLIAEAGDKVAAVILSVLDQAR